MLARIPGHIPEVVIDAERTEVASVVRFGKRVVYGFAGVFLVWGLLVPLESAIEAKGVIATAGNNKLVQHVSGGRVKSILLGEGAHVAKGDLIMVLDPEVNRAELSELQARQAVLLAKKRRLESLIDGTGALVERHASWGIRTGVDRHLETASTGRDAESLGLHRDIYRIQDLEQIFEGQSIDAQLGVLRQQAESLKRERAGLVSMRASAQSGLDDLRNEIRNMKPLVEAGYLARKELWDRARSESQKAGELADMSSRLDRIDAQIVEVANRIDAYLSDQQQAAAKEMTSVLGELAQIRDRLVSAEQALSNTEIRAPDSGTLIAFSANTVGGVLRAGETIGEIVPDNASLVIQARVRPQDIAEVSEGQLARAEISALDRRRYDPIETVLTYVSADAIREPASTTPFYVVHAKPKDDLARLESGDKLKPGMDVNLFINAGSRPFLVYLLSPFITSFERAFNEP